MTTEKKLSKRQQRIQAAKARPPHVTKQMREQERKPVKRSAFMRWL